MQFHEVRNFCSQEIKAAELKDVLEELCSSGKIQFKDGYYFLNGKDAAIIDTRIENEKYLSMKKPKISKYAKLVCSFPFVESVFISGSVSKGVLTAEGDVDYFIIAKTGRLWLCRTLLILFKKVFLLNSKKYFCVNYFVDKNNLSVPDTNLFVATEIKTLVPVFNNGTAASFIATNQWVNATFPNFTSGKAPLFPGSPRKYLISSMIEKACSGNAGEKLDDYFFRKTLRHWRKKFPHFNESQFDLNMRSYKSVSKHHPQGNQARVLNELALRMDKL